MTTHPKKRDERLRQERLALLNYSQGTIVFDDLKVDCLENIGSQIDEQHAKRFLNDFSKQQNAFFSALLPVIVERRIKDQKKDVPVWINHYVAHQETTSEGLSASKAQQDLYRIGVKMGSRLRNDLFAVAMKKMSPFVDVFLQGVHDGVFAESTGTNAKTLMDHALLSEKDVGGFLEGFVIQQDIFSTKNHTWLRQSSSYRARLHLKVLETLFEHGNAPMQQALVLGCGQIAGRMDSNDARVAGKFFGKHYSIEQGKKVIDELEKERGFSWGKSGLSSQQYTKSTRRKALSLFERMKRTPSQALLSKMQSFRSPLTFAELFDDTVKEDFDAFLKEYERKVLLQQLPKKPNQPSKKM